MAARATLRHAFRVLYLDITLVTQESRAFVWQSTFHRTLAALKSALIRRAHAAALLHANTLYTPTPTTIPTKEAEAFFPALIDLGTEGDFSLTEPFDKAIQDAKSAASDEYKKRADARKARAARKRAR